MTTQAQGCFLEFNIPYYQVTNADYYAYATETGTASGSISENFNEGATVNAGILYCGYGYGTDTVNVNSDLTVGTGGRLEVDNQSSTLTYATLNVSQDIYDNGLVEMETGVSVQGVL